jgi:hypothetical protein
MSHCDERMAALCQSESEKFEESKANDKTLVGTSYSYRGALKMFCIDFVGAKM